MKEISGLSSRMANIQDLLGKARMRRSFPFFFVSRRMLKYGTDAKAMMASRRPDSGITD